MLHLARQDDIVQFHPEHHLKLNVATLVHDMYVHRNRDWVAFNELCVLTDTGVVLPPQ